MKLPADPFHKLPPTAQKWAWFIGLWLASVTVLGAVASLIRAIIL